VLVVDKIQFYIPALFEFTDNRKSMNKEEIKVVGVKTRNIKYFSGYCESDKTHIDQIVAEDFAIYDLQLDCKANLLSFYLQSKVKPNQTEVLEKVFQTFVVKYSSHTIGYLTISKGRHRPRSLVK